MPPPGTCSILVVDDDEEIADALADLLAEEGYEVISARDCEHALSLVGEHEPTFVLLDWHLGPMSGATFLEHVAACSETLAVPIYLMTGDETVLAEPPPGVVGVLRKPLDVPKLLAIAAGHRR